jgi:hypothetical protein
MPVSSRALHTDEGVELQQESRLEDAKDANLGGIDDLGWLLDQLKYVVAL